MLYKLCTTKKSFQGPLGSAFRRINPFSMAQSVDLIMAKQIMDYIWGIVGIHLVSGGWLVRNQTLLDIFQESTQIATLLMSSETWTTDASQTQVAMVGLDIFPNTKIWFNFTSYLITHQPISGKHYLERVFALGFASGIYCLAIFRLSQPGGFSGPFDIQHQPNVGPLVTSLLSKHLCQTFQP